MTSKRLSMPSIKPDYAYDVFISYRQKDNLPVAGGFGQNGDEGWVSVFVQALKNELSATFKEDISVYFDANPHDGLREMHDVDDTLREKIKCLVFIPIVSRTYCDPKCFAWQKEFLAFKQFAKTDKYGLKVTLPNGNVCSRILPVKIHDLDPADVQLFEQETEGVLRSIDYVYRAPGVNRPLRPSDGSETNLNKTYYPDQTNKVANSIKEIIDGLSDEKREKTVSVSDNTEQSKDIAKRPGVRALKRPAIWGAVTLLVLISALFFYFRKWPQLRNKEDISVAIVPLRYISGNEEYKNIGVGMATEIRNSLSMTRQIRKLSSMQATYRFTDSDVPPEDISKELGVRYILTGSYQVVNNKTIVNLELIDASNGPDIESRSFEGDIADIFELQSSIAAFVTQEFKLFHSNQQQNKHTLNLKAYTHYLAGNELIEKGFEYSQVAIGEYLKAIELDSGYLSAWVGLVHATSNVIWHHGNKDPLLNLMVDDFMAYVEANFQGSWEKDLARGIYQYHAKGNINEGLRFLRSALAIHPENSLANATIAWIYRRKLLFNEMTVHVKKALEQDPGSPQVLDQFSSGMALGGDIKRAVIISGMAASNGDHTAINRSWEWFVRLKGVDNSTAPPVFKAPSNNIKFEESYYQRKFLECLELLDRREVDFSEDEILILKAKIHHLLLNSDSAKIYATDYMRFVDGQPEKFHGYYVAQANAIVGDPDRALIVSDSLMQRNLNWVPPDTTDLQAYCHHVLEKIKVEALAGQFDKATATLLSLNKQFPSFGYYLPLLSDPIFDKVKNEWPPFKKALENLTLPAPFINSEDLAAMGLMDN